MKNKLMKALMGVVDKGSDNALSRMVANRFDDAVNIKPNGWVKKKIPISMIEHGESAMPGGKMTLPDAASRIDDYAKRMTPLPPIELIPPDDVGGLYMISDGSHRFEAAKRRGQMTIDAFIPPN